MLHIVRQHHDCEPGRGPTLTSMTLVILVVILYGALNSRGYGRALALGGATAAGAAVVIGKTALPTFYAVSIGVVVILMHRLIKRWRADDDIPAHEPAPGTLPLILLAVWATLVTIAAPALFHGLEVLAPDGDRSALSTGELTTSNIAQIFYLFLGVCVVLFLARFEHAGPELIGLAAGLSTLLSFWRYLSVTFGLPFPEGVFDNSPSFAFIETSAGGGERFRGILSEPSGLAISSLVTIAYMLSRWGQLRGWRRWAALMVAIIATYLASISTSGTFVVAGVVLSVIAALAFLSRIVLLRGALKPAFVLAGCVGVIVSLYVLPLVAVFVEKTVDDKVSSSSFSERSGADSLSYNLFFDTFGLGVGLGSNRPSSFLAAMLSTVGLVGTALFVLAVVIIVWRSSSLPEYRPVIWALIALLITKVVAGPDLSDSSGILWISLGVLARGALLSARLLRAHDDAGPAFSRPRASPLRRNGDVFTQPRRRWDEKKP